MVSGSLSPEIPFQTINSWQSNWTDSGAGWSRSKPNLRRLIDLYQAGLVDLADVQRREAEIDNRRRQFEHQRDALIAERHDLVSKTRLRQRVETFAESVRQNIDRLDFEGRQRMLRLLIDEVRVTGCHVDIRLRIPLDEPPPATAPATPLGPRRKPGPAVSTDMRLRSLGDRQRRMVVGRQYLSSLQAARS